MRLSNLISSVHPEHKNIKVNNICFNSKGVKKDDIFFAIPGTKINGEKFINEAINKGASAVVCRKKFKDKLKYKNFIQVEDVRKTLSEACSNYYKKKPKNLLAVTGTNGKTSVAHFFNQILKHNRVNVASIGTLGVQSKKFNQSTNLTTIDPLLLHKILEKLKNKKINNVIIEASSHGLDQKRLNNLKFRCGIFTNLSHDHLDYHRTMKGYRSAKLRLFETILPKNSTAVLNADSYHRK